MNYQALIKFIKFGITGMSGMCLDFGITWLCKEKIRWNKYLSNSCGFSVAVINNYIINRFWTFKSSSPDWVTEFAKFSLFSIIGLGLNNFFLFIFHEKMKARFYMAKVLATGCVLIWNFGSNYYFNFNK